MRSNQQIELARLLGFIVVVTVHGNALGMFSRGNEATGWVIDEAGRFAVPVFFLISGYFWKPAKTQLGPYLQKLFGKLILPFLFWAAVYIALDATQTLYPVPAQHSWRTYLTTPWTGSVAYHLWFLPALLVGSAIGLGLIKMIGPQKALWATLALYLLGALLGTYLRPLGIIIPLGVYRNGILFAPIFLVGGYILALRPELPGAKTFLLIAALGLLLQLLEGYFVFEAYPRGHDMSLGTLPLAFGIFGFFLQLNWTGGPLPGWGRDVFGAYLVHVLLLQTVVGHLAPSTSLPFTLGVIAIIIVLSLVISRLAKLNPYSRVVMP
ncbi:acyltransferase [Neorhizobium alkalisoli]|uniref:Surface polysaccharide O-acyltransferase-like enzyme n=1 Tax=Neorhizobium alkalisoli TaxID=528178 RepID=A0A561R7T5_9HYPH|nr:acyltransferase [Neorhizobium alkalisoli]TWF58658.1 surface polysaccharide O-acyltransferase-like enzyme [Neorhizobium alkalisoli]